MTRFRWNLVMLLTALLASAVGTCSARADEYTVAALKEAPPADGVAKEILDQLAPAGLRVSSGAGPYCDIWLRKELPAKADFAPTNEIKFPFQPGELMGLIRYHKKAQDFRTQDIKPGVYTLRSALQPVDGNHQGTADSRDFLLLLRTADDTSAAPIEEKTLFKLSPKVPGTTHPCMLYLRKPADVAELPAMKHEEEAERWCVIFAATPQGGQAGSLPMELVVVGSAKE